MIDTAPGNLIFALSKIGSLPHSISCLTSRDTFLIQLASLMKEIEVGPEEYVKVFHCSGTLAAERVIVTAASCIIDMELYGARSSFIFSYPFFTMQSKARKLSLFIHFQSFLYTVKFLANYADGANT